MVGHRSDSPAYTASIRAYSCRGTSVQLAWELSQGQVVPYLSSHVPVTVPRRDRHMHFGPEFPPPNLARTASCSARPPGTEHYGVSSMATAGAVERPPKWLR